jgi:hypothetical protein
LGERGRWFAEISARLREEREELHRELREASAREQHLRNANASLIAWIVSLLILIVALVVKGLWCA